MTIEELRATTKTAIEKFIIASVEEGLKLLPIEAEKGLYHYYFTLKACEGETINKVVLCFRELGFKCDACGCFTIHISWKESLPKHFKFSLFNKEIEIKMTEQK